MRGGVKVKVKVRVLSNLNSRLCTKCGNQMGYIILYKFQVNIPSSGLIVIKMKLRKNCWWLVDIFFNDIKIILSLVNVIFHCYVRSLVGLE